MPVYTFRFNNGSDAPPYSERLYHSETTALDVALSIAVRLQMPLTVFRGGEIAACDGTAPIVAEVTP